MVGFCCGREKRFDGVTTKLLKLDPRYADERNHSLVINVCYEI